MTDPLYNPLSDDERLVLERLTGSNGSFSRFEIAERIGLPVADVFVACRGLLDRKLVVCSYGQYYVPSYRLEKVPAR